MSAIDIPARVGAILAAGRTQEHLVDVTVVIDDTTVTSCLHATTKVPVDFPAAPTL